MAKTRDLVETRKDGAHQPNTDVNLIKSPISDLASIAKLRAELETVPAVPIERAAELLEVSVRTLYRRRSEFEHQRRKGHLYFTLRGIKQHIELEQYNPTPSFDITIPATFDTFDRPSPDNRNRKAREGAIR